MLLPGALRNVATITGCTGGGATWYCWRNESRRALGELSARGRWALNATGSTRATASRPIQPVAGANVRRGCAVMLAIGRKIRKLMRS